MLARTVPTPSEGGETAEPGGHGSNHTEGERLRKANFTAEVASRGSPGSVRAPGRESVESGRAHGLTFEEVVVLIVAGAHCAAEE